MALALDLAVTAATPYAMRSVVLASCWMPEKNCCMRIEQAVNGLRQAEENASTRAWTFTVVHYRLTW